jgi:acyl carrier protein
LVAEAPALRGVVHAAGLLADAPLSGITSAQMQAVMEPKVEGAWNLHVATEHLTLDFFVLFSSIASVLGSPGQPGYAAANSYLDSLAAYRCAQGLPALAVNWGPWAGDGMAAGHGERLERLGIHLLEPQQALRALEEELSAGRSGQIVIASASFEARRPTAQRPTTSIEDQILQHIARLSGMAPERIDRDRNLADLGIDSLTAMDLVNELEKTLQMKLPVTMDMGEMSVKALAAQITQQLST